MALTPIGWRIWFGDGSVRDSRQATWEGVPSNDVQMVTVYFAETYQRSVQDGWTEDGRPINQRMVTENYCEQLHGQDYYWLDPSTQAIRAGSAADAPSSLPPGAQKRGRSMPEAAWWSLYNRAKENVRFP